MVVLHHSLEPGAAFGQTCLTSLAYFHGQLCFPVLILIHLVKHNLLPEAPRGSKVLVSSGSPQPLMQAVSYEFLAGVSFSLDGCVFDLLAVSFVSN